MIYLSTGGFYKQSAASTVEAILGSTSVAHFELSGGTFDENYQANLLALSSKATLKVHNYYPPPKEPFVLNLASLDTEVLRLSLDHCRLSIDLAEKLNSNSYSFHAGFLLDPKVEELGKPITASGSFYDREGAIEVFKNSVKDLAIYAKSKGIRLLIENNVLSHNNLERFKGENPFLMAAPREACAIMSDLHEYADLLIDVAHLKVSANSLGFNPAEMFYLNNKFIQAYHLSDNDGLADQNRAFDDKSWFWEYLKKGLDYYSIEVYVDEFQFLEEQMKLANKILA